MSKLKNLLEQRFAHNNSQKMRSLAQQSSSGQLSPFNSIFGPTQVSSTEQDKIQRLLQEHAIEQDIPQQDVHLLAFLSAEIKQIHHQSVLLHGERIAKAKQILTHYKEGAFSQWLILTYGNRQTPYNFLLYYELFLSLPDHLKPEAEKMPKQAIYSLASRKGSQEQKEAIIRNYKGENKNTLLSIIRNTFPLDQNDARSARPTQQALALIEKGLSLLESHNQTTALQKKEAILFEKLLKKWEKVKSSLFADNRS